MPDPRQELVELADLVEEVAARVDALGALDELDELDEPDEPSPPAPVAGESPAACEERAVRTAGARLAAQRALEMREGLERIRAQARRAADEARRSGAAARTGAERAAATGDAVERAGWRLAAVPVHDGEVPCDAVLEVVREALPTVRHVGLAALDEQGHPAPEAGDLAVLEAVRAERDTGDGPVRAALDGAAGDGPRAHPGLGHLVALPVTLARPDPADGHPRPVALVLGAPEADAIDLTAARLVATQVAMLLVGARRVVELRRALENRDLIGQAKGIVMQRDGVDAAGAFRTLAQASQHANMKLTSVARWLVDETVGRATD